MDESGGTYTDFNSTIVRLKGDHAIHFNSNDGNFNSTIVRLKDVSTKKANELDDDFNSTIVRLKVTSCGECWICKIISILR